MSAAELRQAAEKLRAYANGSTPGPWSACQEVDGVLAGQWTTVRAGTARIVTVGQTRRHHASEAEINVGYIATVDPRVGLALADWLDKAAADWFALSDDLNEAIAIARLINGGAA